MKNIDSSLSEIRCSFMENNKNYQKILLETLSNLEKSGEKPSLLLHVCCGPCFTIPYEILKDHFKITIIYNNSNIYPEEEYHRRLNELKEYLKEISADINLVEFPYDYLTYIQDLKPMADMPEGHERCRVCFRKRLTMGFKYAAEHGFDYYGTVMTISRYKNAQDLNKIGHELNKDYPSVKWLDADFKKNDGYEKSLLIIKDHNMYLQEYCGCEYSYNKYLERNKNK